jgi:hypothetical protein
MPGSTTFDGNSADVRASAQAWQQPREASRRIEEDNILVTECVGSLAAWDCNRLQRKDFVALVGFDSMRVLSVGSRVLTVCTWNL